MIKTGTLIENRDQLLIVLQEVAGRYYDAFTHVEKQKALVESLPEEEPLNNR